MMVGADPLPRIHVVIPHHRGRALLERCLSTLLASEAVDLRIVVVENACSEPLPAIAKSSGRVDRVASEGSLGFSAANNLGVARAHALYGAPDYYFFANNDTETAPDALSLLARALETDSRRAISGPRVMMRDGLDRLNSLGLNVTRIGEAWDEGIGQRLSDYGPLPPLRPVLAVTGSALLVRASVLRELGGWAELYDFYYEDLDLCLRVRSRGYEVICDSGAVVRHALSATATTGSDFQLLRMWRNRLLLLFVHWPLPLLLAILPRLLFSEFRHAIWHLRGNERVLFRLQLRAWTEALRKLPQAFRLRRGDGPSRDWLTFLQPAGRVPRMGLPPEARAARALSR